MKSLIKESNNGYVKTIEDKITISYNKINSNKDNAIVTVTSIAAITRGKDASNNPLKRFKHLLKEAAPNANIEELLIEDKDYNKVPGRPLEYIPIILKYDLVSMDDSEKDIVVYSTKSGSVGIALDLEDSDIFTFGVKKNGLVYTNARAVASDLIKTKDNEIDYDEIFEDTLKIATDSYAPETKYDQYFILEVKAPYFVFAQMRTHGLLSQVAVSERAVTEDKVWLPYDIMDRFDKLTYTELETIVDINEEIDRKWKMLKVVENIEYLIDLFLSIPVLQVQKILKYLGYKKEIYNRWYNHMKYKTWIIGGWLNNPYGWGHFLLERNAFKNRIKGYVQPETEDIAIMMRDIIKKYLNSK